jgi:hypothetical protein
MEQDCPLTVAEFIAELERTPSDDYGYCIAGRDGRFWGYATGDTREGARAGATYLLDVVRNGLWANGVRRDCEFVDVPPPAIRQVDSERGKQPVAMELL